MKPTQTKLDLLNEIRLSYTVSQGKVYILLEGDSDVKLFRKLFDDTACKIWQVPGGKVVLEQCLEELNPKYSLVIGIRDADFLHLEGKSVETPNVFLTDYHDAEMLMVSNDETFGAVASEHLGVESAKHDQIRTQFLQAIRFISYLRWLNERNVLELSFGEMGLGDFYDKKNWKIDEIGYVRRILARSPNAKITDENQILEHVEALMDADHDLYQLCNGHDFLKVVALQATVSEAHMSSTFRAAYSVNHFRQTRLYRSTLDWATENGVSIHAA